MNEITVNVSQKSGVIAIDNFDEVKNFLNAKLEDYRGIQFTEDTRAEAKKTVAYLRKLKTSIGARVKEVKKEYMEPFDSFEEKVAELYDLIDTPIEEIDKQVKEFEKKRLQEKKSLIRELYQEYVASVTDLLPLERIYNDKWENATTTKKAIVTEMQERVSAVENDLSVICSMKSEFEEQGLEKYRATLRLSDAISVMQTYEKQKQEIIERERERNDHSERGQVNTAEMRQGSIEPIKKSEKEKSGPEIVARKADLDEEFHLAYKVNADPFQQAQLEAAMRKFGIRFKKVIY